MAWPTPTQPTPPNTIHFTAFSALETEYRLLSHHFQQPLCPGCATLGALECPLIYLLALLQPHYCAGDHQLVTSERPLRIIHLWDDQLCPWHPSLAGSWLSLLRCIPHCRYPVCSFKSWTPVPGPAGLSGSSPIRTTMPTSYTPGTRPSLQCKQRYLSCVPTRQVLHRLMHSKSSRRTYSRGRPQPCPLSPSLLLSCNELPPPMTELTG